MQIRTRNFNQVYNLIVDDYLDHNRYVIPSINLDKSRIKSNQP